MKKIFIILLLLFLPLISFGQIGLPEGIKEQISIEFSNSTPDPLEVVSVSIASYTTNLNKADISWLVNGVLEKREVGATKFTFQVGEVGTRTNLSLNIIKSDGTTINKKYSFNPSEVDLLYLAETKTPATYSGKALFSNQAAVKVFAEPRILDANGRLISKENLVYNWKINDFAMQDLSGYGKDFIRYKGSLITRPLKISVEVSPTDSNSTAKKTIVLDPVDPSVLVYENNPVLGVMYEKAIVGDFSLKRDEIEFQAEDLYFSIDSLPVINWFLNGEKIYGSINEKNIVFKNEDESEGQADVSLSIDNTNRILQGNNYSFRLLFENNN